LEIVRDLLRRMPLSDCYAQLSRFQQEMAGDLLSRLHILKSIANPEPPQLADLPASLVDRFVGQHGKHLLKIYGRGDIWDTSALGHFVKEVRTVDPHVTGNPLQAHEASLEMKRSYQEAAVYSLLVIVAVLVLDFKSLHYAVLAALPLGVGVLQMFGLLGVLGIALNPANLIALPLILGIGVDYGVHIVHEFRESQGVYRMSAGTAVAVLVDALTTLVGFGSLMIATHQGLQSLGRVLTLGVTCCLFTSLVMLPALLTLMTRHRQPQGSIEGARPVPAPAVRTTVPRRAAA
jgi:predicted RND superfamily exporter protein